MTSNIYDLWLHNGGSAPVLMANLAGGSEPPPPPCVTPATPENLKATAGKRRVSLTWSAVPEAHGYNLYYTQNGKYALRATVAAPATSYADTGLVAGTTYSYTITAFVNCADGTVRESSYSATATAVPTK